MDTVDEYAEEKEEYPSDSGLPLHQSTRKECFIAYPYTGH